MTFARGLINSTAKLANTPIIRYRAPITIAGIVTIAPTVVIDAKTAIVISPTAKDVAADTNTAFITFVVIAPAKSYPSAFWSAFHSATEIAELKIKYTNALFLKLLTIFLFIFCFRPAAVPIPAVKGIIAGLPLLAKCLTPVLK